MNGANSPSILPGIIMVLIFLVVVVALAIKSRRNQDADPEDHGSQRQDSDWFNWKE